MVQEKMVHLIPPVSTAIILAILVVSIAPKLTLALSVVGAGLLDRRLFAIESILSFSSQLHLPPLSPPDESNERRSLFLNSNFVTSSSAEIAGPASSVSASGIVDPKPRAITTVVVNSSRQSAGLELRDAIIGTPSRHVLAVKSVKRDGAGYKSGAQRGMVLLDYASESDLVTSLVNGPYPIELRLYNLALGGDAIGDLGRSIVSPDDALQLAENVSGGGMDDATVEIRKSEDMADAGGEKKSDQGLVVTTVREARGERAVQSRRGDVMQIRYDARIGDDATGPVYDSSDFRGTGQPYSYVLGNGDVIKGVDLGTYDMCPGEVREIIIPPALGYPNGSRLFKQIPPGSYLFWRVELVELNFVREDS